MTPEKPDPHELELRPVYLTVAGDLGPYEMLLGWQAVCECGKQSQVCGVKELARQWHDWHTTSSAAGGKVLSRRQRDALNG